MTKALSQFTFILISRTRISVTLPLLYKSGNVYVTYMYGSVKDIADGCRFFYSRHYHIVKCHTLGFWGCF